MIQGYTIVALSNGEEALQYVQRTRSEHFDLLLTDVVMPRLSGEQLAEQLLRRRSGAQGFVYIRLHR